MKLHLLDNNCAYMHCRRYGRQFSIPGTPECMCTTYSWQRIILLRFSQTCCLVNHNNALSLDDMSGLRGDYSRGIGKRCDPQPIHMSPAPSLRNSFTVILWSARAPASLYHTWPRNPDRTEAQTVSVIWVVKSPW